MNQAQAFGNGIWIEATEKDVIPFFLRSFFLKGEVKQAQISILGYGSFRFFVNGAMGCEDYFLPLASDFEERDFPTGEQLCHRAYISRFDITSLLVGGENVLSVLLGCGWYTGQHKDKPYGGYKLCYSISVCYADGSEEEICSSLSDRWVPSYIQESVLRGIERQSFSAWNDGCMKAGFSEKNSYPVRAARAVQTDFQLTDCPTDRVTQTVTPRLVKKDENGAIYDALCNLSGIPVLRCSGKTEVTVTFSEELDENGDLDRAQMHSQLFSVTGLGTERTVSAQAIWFGFRYFCVQGDAEAVSVLRVHADVKPCSSFACSDESLNWIYNTYINTQLCNMHYGIPSDCPHLERRGYTGDGQLACRAAMTVLDMRSFYSKWIKDISDCQDRKSGHVQYTAPYTRSGGGPGGWGCAIVVLPYRYEKFYGDDRPARELYPQMLRYFDYLEEHSEANLVISDREGEWCLGEWCTPEDIQLPPPFVNNYFYIKSLEMVIEMAERFGHEKDIPLLQKRLDERKHMMTVAYFDINRTHGRGSNYCGNVQGANAFALDIGLGNQWTKDNFIAHYEKAPYYDTGIFGTDIVTRLLFEYGRGDLAYKLLTAKEPHGFGKWRADGATTFWEYWGKSRSHSHPMFGAVTAYLFEYILGVRQEKSDRGMTALTVAPADIPDLQWAKGHITTPFGEVHVEWKRQENGSIDLWVKAPKDVHITCNVTGKAFID